MPIVKAGRWDINYMQEGAGPDVVLIHGLAGDYNAWKPQVAVLKALYRVVAFDNPGSGKSGNVPAGSTVRDLGECTLRLMDALGIESAQVVGRSMGGAIGHQMALLAPKRVRSLAMAASFAKLDPIGSRLIRNMKEILEWRRNWTDWARHAAPHFVSPEFFIKNRDQMDAIERLIGDESRDQSSYKNLADAILAYDAIDELKGIACPTLIMTGRLDGICSVGTAEIMQEHVRNARTVIFEKSSHFFLMEEAEKAMGVLIDWLAEHA
jgi:3-oxoadipate enol-lactonase